MNKRNLSLDLLRIIAMLLVLIVHMIGIIGTPTIDAFKDNILGSIGVSFLYFISSGCVDIFILLSGWFGIKFSVCKLAGLFFQVVFWNTFSAIVYFVINSDYTQIDILGILSLNESLWFFISYLCLYILSPILNSFVENSSKSDIEKVILYFFVFQTIWCWMFKSAPFFMNGYSPISFIGLYLLSRYASLYPSCLLTLHFKYDILIYALLTMISVFIVTVAALNEILISRMFSYVSPFVILSCLYLLLFFSKIKITKGKKFILFMAPSAFAVYLFHQNSLIYPYFVKLVQCIYINSNMLFVCCFLFLFFVVVAIMDKSRIFLWETITNKFHLN